MPSNESTADGESQSGESRRNGRNAFTRRSLMKGIGAAAVTGGVLGGTTAFSGASEARSFDPHVVRVGPDELGQNDEFGGAVALDAAGRTLVVGAQYADDGDVESGAVYVYRREGDGWKPEAKLRSSDRAKWDYLGAALDVNAAGDVVVAGAPAEDGRAASAGAAYVFVRGEDGSWTQSEKIYTDDTGRFHKLGSAVSLDAAGETVLLGAPGDTDGAGAAYVFTAATDGWTQAAKLTPPERSAEAGFGRAVAIAAGGDRGVVGAPGEAGGTGGVYALDGTGGWSVESRVAGDDGGSGFGSAVGTSDAGDSVAVGAPGSTSDEDGEPGYAAVVHEGGGASPEPLTAEDRAAGDQFGAALEMTADGDRVVVGAPSEDTGAGPDAGAAYVFVRDGDGWSQDDRLVALGTQSGDRVGAAVAADATAGTVALGAPGPGGEEKAPGEVVVFTPPELSIRVSPEIDARPPRLDVDSQGTVAVAFEHTGRLDTTAALDTDTIRFGPPDVVDDGGGARSGYGDAIDWDGDGDDDQVLYFRMQQTGFEEGDAAAKVVAETTDGHRFTATDDVRIVDPDPDRSGSDGSSGSDDGSNAAETDEETRTTEGSEETDARTERETGSETESRTETERETTETETQTERQRDAGSGSESTETERETTETETPTETETRTETRTETQTETETETRTETETETQTPTEATDTETPTETRTETTAEETPTETEVDVDADVDDDGGLFQADYDDRGDEDDEDHDDDDDEDDSDDDDDEDDDHSGRGRGNGNGRGPPDDDDHPGRGPPDDDDHPGRGPPDDKGNQIGGSDDVENFLKAVFKRTEEN